MQKVKYSLPISQRVYLIAILKGMMVTGRHFLRNLLRPGQMPTINYPEIRRK